MARTPYRQRPSYNYKQLEAQQNAPSPSMIYVLYVPTNKILEFCQIGAFKNRVPLRPLASTNWSLGILIQICKEHSLVGLLFMILVIVRQYN